MWKTRHQPSTHMQAILTPEVHPPEITARTLLGRAQPARHFRSPPSSSAPSLPSHPANTITQFHTHTHTHNHTHTHTQTQSHIHTQVHPHVAGRPLAAPAQRGRLPAAVHAQQRRTAAAGHGAGLRVQVCGRQGGGVSGRRCGVRAEEGAGDRRLLGPNPRCAGLPEECSAGDFARLRGAGWRRPSAP